MPAAAPNSTRRDVALLVALCVPLLLVGLGAYDLDLRGEPREGVTAHETIHSNFLLPLLNGERLPEKPLMFPWLVSFAMRVFGETSEWAARLPSALAAVGVVLVVRAIGARLLGARGGLVAATACAATVLVVRLGRDARTDMTLSFFVCLAILQFLAMFQEDEADPGRRPSAARLAMFWLALAFATLTKGPLGVILPALAAGTFLLVRRRVGFVGRLCRWWGVLLFVGVAGGWYLHGLFAAGGQFGFRAFLMENVLMFLGAKEGGGHSHGPLYFVLPYFFWGAPWALFTPAAAVVVVRRARGAWDKEPLLLPLVWCAAMFVFFSAASGKRYDYLLPLLPASALLAAGALDAAQTAPDARRWVAASAWTLAALGIIVAMSGAALAWAPASSLPQVVAERLQAPETRPILDAVNTHPIETAVLLVGIAVVAAAPAVGLSARRPAWGVGVAAAAMAVVAPVGLLRYMPVLRAQDTLKTFTSDMLRTVGPDADVRSWNNFEPQVFFYANRRFPPLAFETDDPKAAAAKLDVYLAEPGEGWVFSNRGSLDAMKPARRGRFDVVLESRRTDTDAAGQCVLLRRRAR